MLTDYVITQDGDDPTTASGTVCTNAEKRAKDAYDGISFLSGLNAERYQGIMDELANS